MIGSQGLIGASLKNFSLLVILLCSGCSTSSSQCWTSKTSILSYLLNQYQKVFGSSRFFSSIHPFTALFFFVYYDMESLTQTLVSKMAFPHTTCLNVVLNSRVCASTVWINIENEERWKSLINTPVLSNTFGRL